MISVVRRCESAAALGGGGYARTGAGGRPLFEALIGSVLSCGRLGDDRGKVRN